MAVTSYPVALGDTLWGIATRFASSISGNTTQAKIDTLVSINRISDPDLIYVGQVIKFSSSGSSSGSPSTPISAQKVTFTGFGLQAGDNDSGRTMVAVWEWNRANTKSFKYRWVEYIPEHDGIPGSWTVINGGTGEITAWEGTVCRASATASDIATRVQLKVIPVAETYKQKVGDKEVDVPYWAEGSGANDVAWAETTAYSFSSNPPLAPGTPEVKIEDKTLTITLDNIDRGKLSAQSIQFSIVKDNKSTIHTSNPIPIVTDLTDKLVPYHYVQYQYTVTYGSVYKVRARSVGINGKTSGWSEFSDNEGTKPAAPEEITVCRRNKRSDGTISAYLEWSEVANAESYVIEYTTIESDFERAPGNIQETETEGARTSIEITNVTSGNDYFFRVRARNNNSEDPSDPTPIVKLPIGEPPAAPTIWSSSKSAFVGESMSLNWTHNARDGSAQSAAQLKMTINGGTPVTFNFVNATTENSGEETVTYEFSYGTAISYKGELHVELNTELSALKNSEINWQVRTAGVTDAFSDTDWSIPGTVCIYEKPTLALSVTKTLDGSDIVTTLDSFPFYIKAEVDLENREIQRAIGYHVRVVSNNVYETVDDIGRTKVVNVGTAVYSKYFDSEGVLLVEMSASNIDLESGMTYTVQCTADMSTGLAIEQQHEFSVSWTDVEYAIRAEISVDKTAYTALITPYCEDKDGNLIENVELSVYRRSYDGTFVEIATHIPNNRTAVTDPHPSLDYARYRLVATDTRTGALSFYDMPGYPVNATDIIVQWDEAWSSFDVEGENSIGGPSWSGSMLKLPYNLSIEDNRTRDVEFVEYAGREHSVSYYGTKINEAPAWSGTIPKDDKDTIYALRRLSLWKGDAYVREPSGQGFWANVSPVFNLDYNEVVVLVSLSITRVEGGK